MFMHLDIHLEYWIETYVTLELLCVKVILTKGVLQALQLIARVLFIAVD